MKYCYLLLLAVFLFSCSKEELPPPNILWISAEDIGPAFGCYGDEFATTPNIDKLAEDGVVYTNAYATAPICAPARSAIITGVYATSMGTQHLRSEVPIPNNLKTIPELMRAEGYYCTNNSKTDYNFDATGRWDENSGEAHWKNKPENAPFFSVFNYGITHEGSGNSYSDEHTKDLEVKHDPEKVKVPPYFPKTEEFKTLWARYYDLITAFDKKVGAHIAELEDAGLLENTIVFIWGDHGFGMPRYKRWLYKTGLHVPMIVHIPEQYKKQFGFSAGKSDRMLSFVDLAPTVLKLAGIEKPDYMQGQSFIASADHKEYIYGARSRADDVNDMSRAIVQDDFIYIRNYMPHLPYIQNAIIFSDRKRSFAELLRLKEEGNLNPEAQKFWEPKAPEELYDLKNDPHEMNNLAGMDEYSDKMNEMRGLLRKKIMYSRYIGFLHESEYMRRAQGSTVYEYAQSENYQLEEIYEAAEMVGNKNVATESLLKQTKNEDSGVRYWTVIALMQRLEKDPELISALETLLDDTSPAVALASAEALCKLDLEESALPVIEKYLRMDEEPTTVLNAAMVARRIGQDACPLVDVVREEFEKYEGNVWNRYKSWSYPMFIGFAFDQIRMNCGEDLGDLRN